MNQFINYSFRDIELSINYNLINKGIIANDKTKKLIAIAEKVIKPPVNESNEDKIIHQYITNQFLKTLKFVLYDRIEVGVKKDGTDLWIGSFSRECFEVLFGSYNCQRAVEVKNKGKKNSDCSVFVTYECSSDNHILNEIPSKYEIVENVEKNSKVIRNIRSRYLKVIFKFNVQTNNVTCDWWQITEKSYNNNWNETY
jgi:hypothetical protein